MTWTISKDCVELIEYTSMYPWIPMKCFEFRMEYSSYPTLQSALHFETQIAGPCDRALLGKFSTHLPSSIDDLSGVVLALVLDDFAEGILDGGVVAFYEMTVHELHRERGFSLFTVSTR
jgi:hypothetical protein